MSDGTTAIGLTTKMAAGEITARGVMEAHLGHIDKHEGTVRAFAHLSPQNALNQADALDAARASGAPTGPLHGVPVGVKDIIDTKDLPTENGSPLDAGRCPSADARLVARLRSAGAVIVGKTVTTEFAFRNPGPTTNPHNPAHTPGGSSSGSAAAVAAGMVPLAIGTQTAGSMIRPATFCGVVGYKPTHGRVPTDGVLRVAPELDTIGVFAADVPDAALAAAVMMADDDMVTSAAFDDLAAAARTVAMTPPRLAIVKGPMWPSAEPETVQLFDDIERRLGRCAQIVDLPGTFDDVIAEQHRFMSVGYTYNLRAYRERGENQLSPVLRELMAEASATSALDYEGARQMQVALRTAVDEILCEYDAILTPGAPGEAPKGLSSTGSSVFNAMWTYAGVPCVTLPIAKGPTGLPMGIQVVGRFGHDSRLMPVVNWVNHALTNLTMAP